MNPDGTFYVCEACREVVEPDAAGVIRAHELIQTRSLNGNDPPIEGRGVFFHKHHYPRSSGRYRRAS
jgi:hypothetical protein